MSHVVPPHLAPSQFQLLQDRVARQYGEFGAAIETQESQEALFADSWWKTTLRIVLGVFLASAFLAFASHPTVTPGGWENSFRLDTVFVVVWAPLLVWTMSRLKLWRSVRIYLVLALFIESLSETMFRELGEGGYWNSVLWPAAAAFYGTLKEFSNVPGGSVGTFFLLTLGLLYRSIWGKKAADYVAPPAFARNTLLVFLCTIVVLAFWGIAHGGQVDWTFRQTIHLLQLPLVALVFLYGLRIPRDLPAIGTAFVLIAMVRSLLVLWVYFGVCTFGIGGVAVAGTVRHGVPQPEWCTNHSDTVLFVVALGILLAHALEQRHRRTTLRCLAAGAVIMAGIIFNNRRLAFVSLAAVPLVMYLALEPSKRKLRVTIALGLLIPVVIGYVLIGSEMTSRSVLLKPAKLVMSVVDQRDTSSEARDIENENLIYTLEQSPFVPSGFGHEYLHSPNNPPVDLTEVFANYKLLAHNGVLWLWSIAGVVGFTLLWMLYPIAGTLALRAYRGALTPLERSASLAALATVAICVIQIWGDQGFSSYLTLVTFGVAFAVASRLAVRAEQGGRTVARPW